MSSSKKSIARTVVTLLFIIGIVPLIIQMLIFFGFFFDSNKRGAANVQQEIAYRLSSDISSYFQKITGQVILFAKMLEHHWSDADSLTPLAYEFLDLGEEYDGLTYIDPDGREHFKVSRYYTYRPSELGRINNTAALKAVQGGKIHIGKAEISPLTRLPVVRVTVPVKKIDDTTAGAFQVSVNISKMWKIISKHRIGSDYFAYIVDADGFLIGSQDLSSVLQKKNLNFNQSVRRLLNGQTGGGVYEGFNHKQVIGAAAPIDVTGWGVVVESPLNIAYRGVFTLSSIFISISLITIIVALMLGLHFSYERIVHPIRRLRKEALEIARGRRAAHIRMDQHDELGQLADAFNRMVNDLEHTTVTKDRLEQEVEERKRIEWALREERDRTQKYLDIAGVILLVLDNKGKIVLLNRQGYDILGYEKGSLIGRSWFDTVIPKPELNKVRNAFQYLMDGNSEQIGWYENQVVVQDGSLRWIAWNNTVLTDDQGNVTGTLSSGEDVTERRNAEAERRLLATAISQTAEIVMMTDDKAVIQYVNPAFERVCGYSRSEVIGKRVSIIKSGKHSDLFFHDLWRTISNGQVWAGTIINRKKDGKLYEVDTTISPVRNEEGKIVNYVSVQRDVTREKEMEQQLRQAHKMEAIGTLAGGIAHDFNNILAAVIGFTELTLDDLSDPALVKSNLEGVLNAGYRARDLVKQILTFSRQDDQTSEEIYPSPIVKEALKLLRASLPSTVEIRQTVTSESLIIGNPIQIHQVVMNLCTNAGYAMRENGGVLSISLEDVTVDETEAGQHTSLSAGSFQLLTVQDTGAGIRDEVKQRIFEPFFTTKSVGEGTGMGLSVVHGIVTNLGGVILVDSIPGKGTAFRVYLPTAVAETDALPEDVRNTSKPLGKERILWVDDEPQITQMGSRMLQRLGYRVTVCTKSSDALEYIISDPAYFDLVITDLTMPVMTGTELAAAISRNRPDLPVLLCTGYSDQAVNKESFKYIRKIIEKPVSMNELALIIRNVLEETE